MIYLCPGQIWCSPFTSENLYLIGVPLKNGVLKVVESLITQFLIDICCSYLVCECVVGPCRPQNSQNQLSVKSKMADGAQIRNG